MAENATQFDVVETLWQSERKERGKRESKLKTVVSSRMESGRQ
jgi:hypothetical protein